ncbi:peptide deformylase [Vibrio porteresiae]|uniref:Peptide deformylase-like n=1 Tax=Vibrio porteresiae DSM 19223 TaxID=1123496 RepID=A0ABZ0QDF1_9VIBR|nr:peptide deformylase [Vibrio porteresiae]WPC74434.1 peptide deformylase [Vibrio porteresiae DSM 19223]
MAETILWIDDPKMQGASALVECFDDDLASLVNKMFSCIEQYKESGLAAIQLGVAQQVIVIAIDDEYANHHRLALVNPVITWSSEQMTQHLELCSSIPQHPLPVSRSKEVTVQYQDIHGQSQQWQTKGVVAVCLQHLIEHLSGHSLLDHLSSLKKQRVKKGLIKLHRHSV